jgi:precorrin-2 dehydrogenase
VSKPPSRLSGEKTSLFPMFVKLAKRRCLVVGAGKPAEEKIPTLLRCGATVIVVAPVATRTIKAWAADNKIIWESAASKLATWTVFFSPLRPPL